MNWEAVGAIGEILGAMAVVATLGYLAVQIRQSTRVARSSARQAIAEMTIVSSSDLVEREMADLFLRDLRGEELRDADRIRLLARSYRVMRNWENIHYQYLVGMLSGSEWEGLRLNLKSILQWPSMRDYWANEKQYFSRTFQSEVSVIEQELEAIRGLDHQYVLGRRIDDA